ncbi:MAG: serine hydrolase domain-containing protein [Gemmatimonadaceae bacterium]
MMKTQFSFLMLVLWPSALVAQVNEATAATQNHTSSKGLAAKIDRLFASLATPNSPGAAVTVIENGTVIARKAYGLASIEHEVPFTHRTVVKMPYSEGREFIAISAVLMEQDGVLKLDDKVRRFFPNLPAWAESVTIWDLLNHRSGFIDEWDALLLTQASMGNRVDQSQFLQLLYHQPTPEVEPGKGYMYSNSDFGLLRLIEEKASGQDLSVWMTKRMFEPLKMSSTRLSDNSLEIIPKLATTYYGSGGDSRLGYPDKTSPGGNYSITTSAADLEKWAKAHSDTVSEIARAAARLRANVRRLPGKENHHVVGYTVREVNRQQVVVHEGVNEYNYLTRIPHKGLSVITLGNLGGSGYSRENASIVDFLLKVPTPSAPLKPQLLTKAISVATEELKRYGGRYVWQDQKSWESETEVRRTSDILLDGDVLKIRVIGNVTFLLTPVGQDMFYNPAGPGAQYEFSRSNVNERMNLRVRFGDGSPDIRMQKQADEIWHPSSQALSRFTGKYYSKHLDYYWTVVLDDDGKLVIKRPTIADTVLEPDTQDQFILSIEVYPGTVGGDAAVRFHDDGQGHITHLTVSHPRLMHHRFDRVGP